MNTNTQQLVMSTYYVQHHFFSTQTTSILMMMTCNSSFAATLVDTEQQFAVITPASLSPSCQSTKNMSWCQLEILSQLRLLTLVMTNQRPVHWSRDLARPMRGSETEERSCNGVCVKLMIPHYFIIRGNNKD